MSLQLNAPQPLAATHILDEFECGEAVLDEWLKRRAITNQMSGASRTFVVTDQDSRVYGYYAMAAGAVSHQMATSSVRRKMTKAAHRYDRYFVHDAFVTIYRKSDAKKLSKVARVATMTDPVPVMVLARLAVDHRAQGIKLGASLLQDAVNRAVVVSQNAGVRALLVHALHDRAKEFYEHYGFQSSPLHLMTLMLRLNTSKP